MSVKLENKPAVETFEFTKANHKLARESIDRYPAGRQASAVIDLLYLAQEQNDNWLPKCALDYVADYLEMPRIRVYEVASFYTMFNLAPVGKYHLQVCGTTPCWLRGSDEIFATCEKKLGIKKGETTSDGMFTLAEVECLGACANAPMMQVNNKDFYEDLTPENFEKLLDDLAAGRKVKTGSQIGRVCSSAQDSKPKSQKKS
jgi:NADH-quinone oxidoreductase E subunit